MTNQHKFLTSLCLSFKRMLPEYNNSWITAEPIGRVKIDGHEQMEIELKSGKEVVAHYYHFLPAWKQLEQPVLTEDEYQNFSKIYYNSFKIKKSERNTISEF